MTYDIRGADLADLPGIAEVARATDQAGEGAGADPRYSAHLLTRGKLVVALDQSTAGHRVAVGYAATVRLADVDLLSDLFVLPARHGEGIGRALLEEVWSNAPERMTFSSAHPRAIPLYLKFGLIPQWPVLYLTGDPAGLPAGTYRGDPIAVDEVSTSVAVKAERRMGGEDRSDDYAYWAARPASRIVVVSHGTDPIAVGATGGEAEGQGISHLRVAEPTFAEPALLAVLATLTGPCVVAAPGPIGGIATLVNSGWRVVDTDQFAASAPDLVDPLVVFPHSGLL